MTGLNPHITFTQALGAATRRNGVLVGTVVFLFALIRTVVR